LLAFAAKRVGALIPILLSVALVTFILTLLIPGSPVDAILPPEAPPEARAQVTEELNLDDNIVARFGAWLEHAAQGDFGQSFQRSDPAREVMLTALRNTLQLALAALIIALTFGILGGIAMGWWADQTSGRTLNVFVVALASVPQFWLGLILLYVFAVKLRWLPTGGITPVTGSSDFGTRIEHLVLPAITVSLLPLAVIARLTRALVLEMRRQDFVVTLVTRGYTTRRILRHVLRNSAAGVVNIAGLQMGYIVLGTLFAEVVFSWPGIGTAIVNAIESRDYPVIQAIVLATGVMFACITVVVDLLMRALDPRMEQYS
jgi:peptide/nickel transport system permease protein